MGRSGYILTPKQNDPDDARRRDEIENNFRPRKTRLLTSNPGIKQLQDGDEVLVDDGTDVTIVRRIGNKLYKVSLTEIT